uniref:Uncharacterized protein n=1 Tax=Lotharella oceanica TaxID=641309 RepID=A0A7S2TGY5_9EUKA
MLARQLNVDFDQPKDYKDPQRNKPRSDGTGSSSSSALVAAGTSQENQDPGVWGEAKGAAGPTRPRGGGRKYHFKNLTGGKALGGREAVAGAKRKLKGGLVLPVKKRGVVLPVKKRARAKAK